VSLGRLGALIPVRLSSERLPGKALREICGRPVIFHLLDRVCASRHVGDKRNVVVCTTTHDSDAPLIASVEGYGCSVFRGSENDIIQRFADAMDAFDFDAVIQVDGDDPLTATDYMDKTLDALIDDPEKGIVVSDGLPLGVNCKSFTRAAMRKVYAQYRTQRNDTGFIYFFTKTGLFDVGVVRPSTSDHVLDGARLTLDYTEDFEVFCRIFEALYRPGEVFGLDEFIPFLKEHPEVLAINSQLDEEYWKRTREQSQLEFQDTDGTVTTIT
jgi:spore coat polysaccharide biosynthesis protein SpsF